MTMSMQQLIEAKLGAAFSPSVLQVENESHQHNVPAGSESHFKVVIVSAEFAGKRQVARHQAVYACLAEQLKGALHALALHTYTADEWQDRQAAAPESPRCLGGSKADHGKQTA